MRKIIIALILLAVTVTGAYAALDVRQSASGELLDAFALPDGGSLVISLTGSGEILVTHTHQGGDYTRELAALRNPLPDTIYAAVCGTRVHVFANYISADPQAVDSAIDEYVFELDTDSGICENRVHKLILPVIKND